MAIEAIGAAAALAECGKEAAAEAVRQLAEKIATESLRSGTEISCQRVAQEVTASNPGLTVEQINSPYELSDAETSENAAIDNLNSKIESDGLNNEASESSNEIEITQADIDRAFEGTSNFDIHTRNEGLEGDCHPRTGVEFVRKTVEDAEGNQVTGVFAKFESTFDAQLPDDMLKSSDREQFSECNRQLKDAIANDPELFKKFTPDQLEQIENGDTPDGYTWHHNEEKGKMQLVDSDIHAQTGHTGGRAIWGGGSEFRG